MEKSPQLVVFLCMGY